jgi:hypothetical protein
MEKLFDSKKQSFGFKFQCNSGVIVQRIQALIRELLLRGINAKCIYLIENRMI